MIATEKKVKSPLVDDSTVERLVSITDGIGMFALLLRARCLRHTIVNEPAGMAYAGMGPDFRLLTRKAQKKAQEYYLTYKVGPLFCCRCMRE